MIKIIFKILVLILLFSNIAFAQTKQPWMVQVDQQMMLMRSALPSITDSQIAVMKNGQLIYANAYGVQDTQNTPANNQTLFRIGSVSKTLTATATLKLIQNGLLSLDSQPFCQPNAPSNCTCPNGEGIFASQITLPPGQNINPQVCNLTIYELLTMSAGFCEPTGGDYYPNSPCYGLPVIDRMSVASSYAALSAYGLNGNNPNQLPATQEQVAGYFLSQPSSGILYTPGTAYNYSDFSYLLLAVIDNLITQSNFSMSFTQYVQSFLSNNAGVTDMQIGGSLLSQRINNETEYFDFPGAPLIQSVFPPANGPLVPEPYGVFYMPAHQGNGGWVASATDLVNFINAIGSPQQAGILSQATINSMLAKPNFPMWQGKNAYFGMGWDVVDDNGNVSWNKNGGLPGTSAQVLRTFDNIIIAVVFNSAPAGVQENAFVLMENNIINLAAQGARSS